jgi:DnaJ-class molecular chaperone
MRSRFLTCPTCSGSGVVTQYPAQRVARERRREECRRACARCRGTGGDCRACSGRGYQIEVVDYSTGYAERVLYAIAT